MTSIKADHATIASPDAQPQDSRSQPGAIIAALKTLAQNVATATRRVLGAHAVPATAPLPAKRSARNDRRIDWAALTRELRSERGATVPGIQRWFDRV